MQKYIIETKRLGFRIFQQSDIDYLAELNSDAEVRKFFPDGVQTREQTEARMRDYSAYYQDKGLPCFVMFEHNTGEFVGRCGFGLIETGEVEVGYLLHKRFWGQGLASEALAALLEWAKHHIDVNYIIAFAPVEHLASLRVMQKCGMKYDKDAMAKGVMCKFYRTENRVV